MSKQFRTAFTLIELLVVIAIICLLAAILFPVFQTAREKARQSTCASNEKQVGLAILSYVQDFDDSFPSGLGMGIFYDNEGAGWGQQVYPYVKNINVFVCPDDAASPGHTKPYQSYYGNSNVFGNGDLSTSNTSYSKYSRVVNKLVSPAKTIMCCEMGGFYQSITDTNVNYLCPTWNGLPYSYAASTGNNNLWGAAGSTPETGVLGGVGSTAVTAGAPTIGRHSGGSNFLYADGHVKWLLPQLVSPGWDASSSTSAQVPGTYGTAAGTDDSTFSATFSGI